MALQIKKISSILFFLLLSIQITTTSDVVEGDMLLTDEQKELLYNSDDDSMRNGLVHAKYRWPYGIMPFEIDTRSYNHQQVNLILNVIQAINSMSCVQIRPRQRQDRYWITISDPNRGCQAAVGFRRKPNQSVFLNASPIGTRCFQFGSVAHELLHALGFYHMQSTSERDGSINIIWQNIQQGRAHNFKKYGPNLVTSFGYPYDYDSVLHYSTNAFTKNGQPTIVPKQPTNVRIGQRSHISQLDILKLNTMYQCGRGEPR